MYTYTHESYLHNDHDRNSDRPICFSPTLFDTLPERWGDTIVVIITFPYPFWENNFFFVAKTICPTRVVVIDRRVYAAASAGEYKYTKKKGFALVAFVPAVRVGRPERRAVRKFVCGESRSITRRPAFPTRGKLGCGGPVGNTVTADGVGRLKLEGADVSGETWFNMSSYGRGSRCFLMITNVGWCDDMNHFATRQKKIFYFSL